MGLLGSGDLDLEVSVGVSVDGDGPGAAADGAVLHVSSRGFWVYVEVYELEAVGALDGLGVHGPSIASGSGPGLALWGHDGLG